MKTLLITDTNSILNRAFYAIRTNLTNKEGLPTGAVYGMVNIIAKQLGALEPDYLAAAFDLKEKTFRSDLFADYKAHRKPMPEELALQLAPAKECLAAMGFAVLEAPGYEADDIIGTVAAAAAERGIFVYILTGDRDSLQLVCERVTVLLTTNTEVVPYDVAKFKETYGILPGQFVDVKALMGDASDNIPGVAGIGEKTALRLIADFGTLEGVYENLADGRIKPGERAKLEAGRESAFLSRTLAAIRKDVPLPRGVEELKNPGFDRPALAGVFGRLGFASLIARFGLAEAPAVDGAAQALPPAKEAGPELLAALRGKTFAVAAETGEGGPALHVWDGQTRFICRDRDTMAALLASPGFRTVCHDKKALCHFAAGLGASYENCVFDVMLAAYLLAPGASAYTLEKLAADRLGTGMDEGSVRPDLVFALYEALRPLLAESGQAQLLSEIELPLAEVLCDMEQAGFCVDSEGLYKYGQQLARHEALLAERIYAEAGFEFNLNSPKQLGEVLFDRLGLPAGRKTKSGYSTDAEVLAKLAPYHPIVSDILDYRQVAKLRATYADGLLKMVAGDGRIHTVFKQAGTATGRLSSVDPNLQNIPIRTDLGRELRRYFVAKSPDHVLIDADYSQIELRILAHIADDKRMQAAFAAGEDIHAATAAAVFGIPQSAVTPELRKRAKAVNFGIVYGIGDFSLAADLGISRAQAKAFIEVYLATFDGVARYLKEIVQSAYETGYVTTLFGRRRPIPELKAKNKNLVAFGERVAMNSPIQGSAADIIKLAMINVCRRLAAEGLDARLILQVHDELVIESAKSCAEAAAKILQEEMEGAVTLKVPLTVDISSGPNWLCK